MALGSAALPPIWKNRIGFTHPSLSEPIRRFPNADELALSFRDFISRGLVLYMPSVRFVPHRPDTITEVFDRSPYNNHGSIYGAVWQTLASGKSVLSFDGVDDYVRVNDSPSLNPTEEITLCAWVLLREKKTQGIIGRDGYWHLECYGDSAKFAFEGKFGGAWHLLLSDYVPELNKWYFVCSVFKANYVGLYVNCEEVKSADWGEGIGTTSPRNIFIGKTTWAYFAGDAKYFNGLIDEARIYNIALSEEVIKRLFNLTRAFYGV